jgi:hypothetical protein
VRKRKQKVLKETDERQTNLRKKKEKWMERKFMNKEREHEDIENSNERSKGRNKQRKTVWRKEKGKKKEHCEDYCLTALTPCSLAEVYLYFG